MRAFAVSHVYHVYCLCAVLLYSRPTETHTSHIVSVSHNLTSMAERKPNPHSATLEEIVCTERAVPRDRGHER